MDVGQYRYALAIRDARNALVLGLLIRIPMFAGTVLLTLHVVIALGRSYGQAGLVAAAATIAIAISGPWRGRLLDRLGLRRTVAPSLVVQAVCWSIAPFVDYLPLMALAASAGLFVVPTFSILRQVIIRSVPEHHRRSALSLDSAGTEIAFMAGPALGVWLATVWNTGWALFACEMAAVLAGCLLWVANPAIKGDPVAEPQPVADAVTGGLALGCTVDGSIGPADQPRSTDHPVPADETVPLRAWRGFITGPVAMVYLAALSTTLVLSGSDVAIVAALRSFDATGSIGWILALWGGGSLIGGLVYGAWPRSFPVYWLLGGLALTTVPVALAVGVPSFAVLLVLSGPFCAPTITATVEHLSTVVPERFRGEMMGWHGSAMTGGSAVGAPVAGFAIDHGGWQWGFVVVSVAGVVVALLGVLLSRRESGRLARVHADSGSGFAAATLEH
ncbi:MAG: MFS transporter [Humibacillus sp.]|nr:MFS transporter [Humibacillus sp.]MDN5777817.1 MFS transporter [Humibacillus sp.]